MHEPRLVAAIVVAGGVGNRFGRPGGKQLAQLLGKPVVGWVLDAIAATTAIDFIVLVGHEDQLDEFESLAAAIRPQKPVHVVPGGATRRASVAAGLRAVDEDAATIVVHDGARPLATTALFDAALDRFHSVGTDGLVVGHGSVDTVKVVSGTRVVETPARDSIWAVQTPQVFKADVLRRAHRSADIDGFDGTDDASIVEHDGGSVSVFEGPRDNIKVTAQDDLHIAEHILKRRSLEGV